MGVEIERKWLLDKPMSGNIKCIGQMSTWYLSVEPEVRVRRLHDTVSGSVCKFAFKTCGTLSRIEIEKYITAEELECCLESLPENLRNNPIVDNYIMFEVGGVEAACIEVDGQYTIVEVEFDNVEAANAYTPPFEGTEVTDNPDYYKETIGRRQDWRSK